MDQKSKLFKRAVEYAGATYKEGDEPTLVTFRARKDYSNGALDERARIRKRFQDNLRELQEGHARLKKLIDELEEAIK